MIRPLRQIAIAAVVLALGTVVLLGQKRPGDVPYTPTQLEWVSLEFQARHRMTLTDPDVGFAVEFAADRDGQTLVCLIATTRGASAVSVRSARERINRAFDGYKKERGWDWLTLRMVEETLSK